MKSGHKPRDRDAAGGGNSRLTLKHDRKLQQLCRQAHHALMYVLPGDMADPLLQELSVQEVLPAPDAGRLMVRLATTRSASEAADIMQRLLRVAPRLRAEVAGTITRKHAPQLAFQLVFSQEVEP